MYASISNVPPRCWNFIPLHLSEHLAQIQQLLEVTRSTGFLRRISNRVVVANFFSLSTDRPRPKSNLFLITTLVSGAAEISMDFAVLCDTCFETTGVSFI